MVIYRFTLQKTAIIGIALSGIDIFFSEIMLHLETQENRNKPNNTSSTQDISCISFAKAC